MAFELDPLYDDLDFLTPLSQLRARVLADFIAAVPQGTVVDVGCGWAELLLRVLAANKKLRGIGLDIDQELLDHAARLASERGVADRLELVRADGASGAPKQADAIISMGASTIWSPNEYGVVDYQGALASMRSLLRPGGRLVFGENIWRDGVATSRAQTVLGGRPDEFCRMGELVEYAVEAGFLLSSAYETTQGEWDRFESSFASGYARWLETHPADDPDADAVRELAARHRRNYYGGYRGVLSMAYLCLVAV